MDKKLIAFAFIIVGFFLGIFYSTMIRLPENKKTAPSEQENLLEVLVLECYSSGNSYFITGEIKNIGKNPLDDVAVEGIINTESGGFVKSEIALIESRLLFLSQKSFFTVELILSPEMMKRTPFQCAVDFRLFGEGTLVPYFY